MAEIVITAENFEREVLQSEVPVLVDFWATWCGPCRMIAPVIDQLAAEYAGRVKVGKINVDEQPELAVQFGIVSIPTVKVFRDGKVAGSLVGLRSQAELEALLR